MTQTSQKVTTLLEDWSSGDQTVPDKLMPWVYDELRCFISQSVTARGASVFIKCLRRIAYVRLEVGTAHRYAVE